MDRHFSPRRVRLFGDDDLAIRRDLRNRVPDIRPAVTPQVLEVLEAGEVAATDVVAALDEVTRHESVRQFVQVRSFPAVPPESGPDHGRCVGNTPADDNVGPVRKCCGDSQTTQVRLSVDWLKGPIGQRLAGVDVLERGLAAVQGFLDRGQHLVSRDPGHLSKSQHQTVPCSFFCLPSPAPKVIVDLQI
ncbi:hypothetical protein VTO42DRAFT_2395 [Malbranchea cinnamomea]